MNTVRSDVCPGCGHSYPCLNDWVAGRCVDCLRMGHVCEYLGHAIARFVRRSEVHAMREIVLDALDNSESVLVEDYVAATRCLRLLAEMAMGEVSGG